MRITTNRTESSINTLIKDFSLENYVRSTEDYDIEMIYRLLVKGDIEYKVLYSTPYIQGDRTANCIKELSLILIKITEGNEYLFLLDSILSYSLNKVLGIVQMTRGFIERYKIQGTSLNDISLEYIQEFLSYIEEDIAREGTLLMVNIGLTDFTQYLIDNTYLSIQPNNYNNPMAGSGYNILYLSKEAPLIELYET